MGTTSFFYPDRYYLSSIVTIINKDIRFVKHIFRTSGALSAAVFFHGFDQCGIPGAYPVRKTFQRVKRSKDLCPEAAFHPGMAKREIVVRMNRAAPDQHPDIRVGNGNPPEIPVGDGDSHRFQISFLCPVAADLPVPLHSGGALEQVHALEENIPAVFFPQGHHGALQVKLPLPGGIVREQVQLGRG